MDQEIEIDVPSYFICPISLEIMKDPVIVSSGITYDRESIEKWLFSGKHSTCPVTKLVVSGDTITPNHNLRRLIQAWCTLNASHGVDRIPTPKLPISKPHAARLLAAASSGKSPEKQADSLRTLRALASDNAANKRCIESAGAVKLLAAIIQTTSFHQEYSILIESALNLLCSLQISDTVLESLLADGGAFLDALTRTMRRGSSHESRASAVLVANAIVRVADPLQLISLKPDFFGEVVHALRDRISPKATKACLEVLARACACGRNRVKAAEAGATAAIVDLLVESPLSGERRSSELALVALDGLCGCAEGRAGVVEHAAGVAVVAKKIMRVSGEGSERAVRVLLSVARFSAAGWVVEEMLQVGVAAKLCLVLQSNCGSRTKEKAKEILRLHARAWKNSPCIPTHLHTSYPAS